MAYLYDKTDDNSPFGIESSSEFSIFESWIVFDKGLMAIGSERFSATTHNAPAYDRLVSPAVASRLKVDVL